MGGDLSCLSCSIANRYSKTIWVKYDVEKKYIQMEESKVEGKWEVGAKGLTAGVSTGVSTTKKYEWNIIDANFSPVNPGDFKELSIDCKGEKVMYVTIIAEDGEIICNSLSTNFKNVVVTEDAQFREAETTQPMKLQHRYDDFEMSGGKPNENSCQKVDSESKSADERTTEKPRRCITNLSTEKLETMTIKSKDDEMDCRITGMAVTNTGTILIADQNNSNIKSVSSDNKVLSVLSLNKKPSVITVLDTTTAVVGTWDKKLYIVNIADNDSLSLRSETQLEYRIWAMVSYNGNIVAICFTKPCTKLITRQGKVLWSVAVDQSERESFTYPDDITITTMNGSAVVIVSNYWKNTLTVLEAETGRYISTIDTGEKKWPEGITVDNDGNVYVCYRHTREIGVWSNDFKESKILLSADKLGRAPHCIVCSAVDDSLYLAYEPPSDRRNTVDRFRLV